MNRRDENLAPFAAAGKLCVGVSMHCLDGISKFFAVAAVLLLLGHAGLAGAQASLAQMREELIAPWLVTVEGEERTRILKISEVTQDVEGSFLLSATIGWTDGAQGIVRIELIQSARERRLIIRLYASDLISVRQEPGGGFSGTYRTGRGVERPVRLEQVTEAQLPQLRKALIEKLAARTFADEDRDWGVAPVKHPQTGRMHAPTPKELPGAKTIRTMELKALLGQSPPPVMIDVLDGSGHRTIPGSHWMGRAGAGVLGNAGSERLKLDLEKLTAGRKSAAIVFFCLSSECWLSYNAGLHAIGLGYSNVYWYRGGINAWRKAGLETAEAEPYRR